MTRRDGIILSVLLLFFAAAGFLRLNDLSLYTDSTRYVIWGTSLAQGEGYVDATRPVPTSFVMNAPLYPVLLAPVHLFFPLSLTAAKAWTLLWAVAGLALLFVWLRSSFSPLSAFLATAFLAFNPLFLVTSTEVLSEAPFLVCSMLILIMLDRFAAGSRDARTRWILFGLLAVVTLLREVGAAFVLAALIVLYRERNGKELLTVGGMAVLLFLLWSIRNTLAAGNEPGEAANMQFMFSRFLSGPNDSLMAEFEARFWLNLKGYLVTIGAAVLHPFPDNLILQPSGLYGTLQSLLVSVRLILTIALAGLVLHGMVKDTPSSPGGLFRLAVFLGYWIIILLYPVHDIRFLLPLLPLVLYYCLKSLADIVARRIPDSLRSKAGLAGAALLILPNMVTDAELIVSNLAYRADPAGLTLPADRETRFDQPWSELGEWIAANLSENTVIASPAKELAPFVHPRKVLETSRALPAPILERTLRDHTAEYLVSGIIWDDFRMFEIAMAESPRLWFEPVHTLGRLTLFRIHSRILEPPSGPAQPAPDTATARGKILAGRRALHRQQYDSSLVFFNEAMHLTPGQPEPVYQLMTVLSIVGDSAATMDLNRHLFTLPQSTIYSALAQAQIGAMTQLLRAERQSIPQRSYTAFEAGLAYWSLGYRATGLAVMRNIARSDSTHFAAALWGCYYAKQLGDTTESFEFLKRLRKIDFSAPIVGDWETMRRLEQQLKASRTAVDQADLHCKIARILARLELYDEALDSFERALRLQPSDIDILLERAEVYEKKKALWAAARTYEDILTLEPHNSFARERLDSLDAR